MKKTTQPGKRRRRRNHRRKNRCRREATTSIFGPDPGDAAEEHAYGEVLEQLRTGMADLRSYPNTTAREKERFLIQTISPRGRILRAILSVAFTLFQVGRDPWRHDRSEKRKDMA